MKKFFSLLFTLICISIADLQSYTYISKVQHPDATNPLTQLRGLYKGDLLNFGDGLAILPEEEYCSHFCFVITPEVAPVHDDLMPHFELKPGLAYAWYNVSCVFEDGRMCWKIEKCDAQTAPKRIPTNAIIFLFEPAFLDTIVDTIYTAGSPATKASSIIHLPALQMKTALTPEERTQLEESLTRSVLAQCDLTAYHTPADRAVKKLHSTAQCMTQSIRTNGK